MSEHLGARRDAGQSILCSALVAVLLLLGEAYTEILNSGTATLVALLVGLALSGICAYRGGGYGASVVCGFLPVAATAIAVAAQNPHIEYASTTVYHAIWSYAVVAVPLATLGFTAGFSAARGRDVRDHGRFLLLVGGMAAAVTTLLWLTCSPFTSWPCGTVYKLL
jgi:hypothetical protein